MPLLKIKKYIYIQTNDNINIKKHLCVLHMVKSLKNTLSKNLVDQGIISLNITIPILINKN
jgi:hypothetical protein